MYFFLILCYYTTESLDFHQNEFKARNTTNEQNGTKMAIYFNF